MAGRARREAEEPYPSMCPQVKIWFQNRRMKWRNSKERELLASGGSREQTLPNKNNPNPDLSDAEVDRARLVQQSPSPELPSSLPPPQDSPPHDWGDQEDSEEDEEINVT